MKTLNQLEYRTYEFVGANRAKVQLPEYKPGTLPLPEFAPLEGREYGLSKEMVDLHREATLYEAYHAQEAMELGVTENRSFGNAIVTRDFVVEEGKHLHGYFSTEHDEGFRSHLNRIHVKKNGLAKLYFLNFDREDVQTFISIAAVLEEGAKLDLYLYDMSDGDTYMNVRCYLDGAESLANIQSIYLGKDEEKMDFQYDVLHQGKDSTSNLIVDGALMDDCRKTFKSRLDFLEGSGGSKGNEEEFAILLDDTARSISIPALLSHEDDVEGNHAASCGHIDQNLLFYIMNRGFTQAQAERLIIDAKFAPVIDNINYVDQREAVYRRLDQIMEDRYGK
ncbi:MAG: SufD family Fe-S cluster assembly protein [Tissierellia bacterium]|nr:SufD family Fe-S cluster assembly protein [Tissierellia bacterium]